MEENYSIFDVFENLFQNKLRYFAIILSMFFASFIYTYFIHKDKYLSNIIIKKVTTFSESVTGASIVGNDIFYLNSFIDNFENKNNFENWKSLHKNSDLKFKDFQYLKITRDDLFKTEAVITFSVSERNINISIQSKDTEYLYDVFSYSKFIANLLTKKYKNRFKKMFNSELATVSEKDNISLKVLKDIMENSDTYNVSLPTKPIRTTLHKYYFNIFSILIGFIFCISYIIMRDSIRTHYKYKYEK